MGFDDALATSFAAIADRFGEDAVIAGAPKRGIFERPYIAVDVGGEVAMASSTPTFTVTAETSVAIGNAVFVRDVHFVVSDIQPDGAGAVRLILRAT